MEKTFWLILLSCGVCSVSAATSFSSNQELQKGEQLESTNGLYKAVFEEDGNFVIYKWTPVWATSTVGTNPYRILLQTDTNLVMYDKTDRPIWDTGTFDRSQTGQRLRLTLTNDGYLVLEKNGVVIWSSQNSHGILRVSGRS